MVPKSQIRCLVPSCSVAGAAHSFLAWTGSMSQRWGFTLGSLAQDTTRIRECQALVCGISPHLAAPLPPEDSAPSTNVVPRTQLPALMSQGIQLPALKSSRPLTLHMADPGASSLSWMIRPGSQNVFPEVWIQPVIRSAVLLMADRKGCTGKGVSVILNTSQSHIRAHKDLVTMALPCRNVRVRSDLVTMTSHHSARSHLVTDRISILPASPSHRAVTS